MAANFQQVEQELASLAQRVSALETRFALQDQAAAKAAAGETDKPAVPEG